MKKLLPIVILLLSGCYYSIEETTRGRAYCEQNGATFVEEANGRGYVVVVYCEKNGKKYFIPDGVLSGRTQ